MTVPVMEVWVMRMRVNEYLVAMRV